MRAARIVLPVLLVGAALWAFGAADVSARLAGADPAWIAAGVAFLLAQTAAMALRWRLAARCLGLGFPAGWAVREYMIGQLVNATVPGGVVGDGARAVRSRPRGGSGPDGLKRAAQAVVIERAMGQVGLAVVAAGGLGWAAVAPGGIAVPGGAWAAAAVATLAAVAWVRVGRPAAFMAGRYQ